MNESRDNLDRAFELLKAPVTGMDFDVSKQRVEELMMREFSQLPSRSRRKSMLAAIIVLTVLVAGGAMAATTVAIKSVQVFLVGPNSTEDEIELISEETGDSAGTLHLQGEVGEIPPGVSIELKLTE
jgi:hypothetical protein